MHGKLEIKVICFILKKLTKLFFEHLLASLCKPHIRLGFCKDISRQLKNARIWNTLVNTLHDAKTFDTKNDFFQSSIKAVVKCTANVDLAISVSNQYKCIKSVWYKNYWNYKHGYVVVGIQYETYLKAKYIFSQPRSKKAIKDRLVQQLYFRDEKTVYGRRVMLFLPQKTSKGFFFGIKSSEDVSEVQNPSRSRCFPLWGSL